MKYQNIFDSHAHYDARQFAPDRDELLQQLPAQGVCAAISCADSEKSCVRNLKLAEQYEYIYATCGVHPHNAKDTDWSTFAAKLRTYLAHPKCVAVGEIGLDYHYDFSPREVQRELFVRQLELAKALDLPVVVHEREAYADVLHLLQQYKPKGVLHCFSGSVEGAREILDLGMYIGLGGAVTFRNAKKPVAVAAAVPLDRLLLETDCPYMTPVPFRGKRNDSALIPYTAQVISSLHGVSVQELLDQTCDNACRLFGIARDVVI